MWHGNSAAIKAVFLAAAMLVSGGCDIGAAPREELTLPRAPGVRYQVDEARNRVWLLSEQGVFLYQGSRAERVAVPLPGWTWAGAPYGCLPDLALGPRGEALVTSDVVASLWRIDPESLAVSVHALALDADQEKDVGFSGLAYSAQHGGFLAASYQHGSLWRIDAQLATARKVSLSAPIPQACGLSVRPRGAQPVLGRLADVCVRTPRGGWSVLFAPDWRSAYVSAAACA